MNNKQLCLLMHLRWLLCYGDFLHLQWMNIQIFLCQHQQNKATELELQFCWGPGHNSMEQGLLLNFSFGDMNEAMQWIGQNETKMRHSSIRHQGHRRSLCFEIITQIYLRQPFYISAKQTKWQCWCDQSLVLCKRLIGEVVQSWRRPLLTSAPLKHQ